MIINKGSEVECEVECLIMFFFVFFLPKKKKETVQLLPVCVCVCYQIFNIFGWVFHRKILSFKIAMSD